MDEDDDSYQNLDISPHWILQHGRFKDTCAYAIGLDKKKLFSVTL